MFNHIDEIWSIDLFDISDYKGTNNIEIGYMLVIKENYSKYAWCIILKNEHAQTMTNDFFKFSKYFKTITYFNRKWPR